MPVDLNRVAQLVKLPKDTRVYSGSLPDRHYIMLHLGTIARCRSISAEVQAILLPAIDAYWEQWEKEIEFRAAEEGISPEEMVVAMLRKAGMIKDDTDESDEV